MIFSAPEGVLSGNRVGDSTAGLTESEIVKMVVDHVTSGFNVARFNMCERGNYLITGKKKNFMKCI